MIINVAKPKDWKGIHILICNQFFGNKKMQYAMYCNVIRETSKDLVFIEVFGSRWREIKGFKQRYVTKDRIALYSDYFKG